MTAGFVGRKKKFAGNEERQWVSLWLVIMYVSTPPNANPTLQILGNSEKIGIVYCTGKIAYRETNCEQ